MNLGADLACGRQPFTPNTSPATGGHGGDMTELVVERTTLLESLDNDTELLKDLVGMFLADFPRMLAVVRAGVVARDPVQITSAAHALKGSISIFGAKKAVAAAQNLESMGRERQLENVVEAFSVLEREAALVTFALEEITKGAV